MAEKLDSFDDRATADWADKYNAVQAGTNYTVTITSSAGRNGTNGLRLIHAGGTIGTFMALTAMPNRTRYQMAWADRVSGLPPGADIRTIAVMRDTGTIHGSLVLNPSGTLSITRAGVVLVTSTFALIPNVFYHLEWDYTVNNTTGASELRVNGVPWAVVTGADTQNAAATQINEVGLYALSSSTVDGFTRDIDDLIIHDQDTFVGDLRVGFYQGDGPGTYSEWTPTGAPTVRECVSEPAQDGDTTYASSATLNQRMTMTFADVPATAVIKFLQHVVYERKSDAGPRTTAPLVRIGSTDYVGTAMAPGTVYSRLLQMQNVSPATGVAWTAAGLNAAEIGDKVIS